MWWTYLATTCTAVLKAGSQGDSGCSRVWVLFLEDAGLFPGKATRVITDHCMTPSPPAWEEKRVQGKKPRDRQVDSAFTRGQVGATQPGRSGGMLQCSLGRYSSGWRKRAESLLRRDFSKRSRVTHSSSLCTPALQISTTLYSKAAQSCSNGESQVLQFWEARTTAPCPSSCPPLILTFLPHPEVLQPQGNRTGVCSWGPCVHVGKCESVHTLHIH